MEQNTNFNFGVGGVVLRNSEILLVRHTYGAAKGKLLIPGGYVQIGEMPEAAVIREIQEETSVVARSNINVILSLWENSLERHPYMFYMGTDFRKLKAPAMWYPKLYALGVAARSRNRRIYVGKN